MILYAFAQFWQSSYKNNKIILSNFAISVALNIVTWALLYWQIHPFSYLTETGNIPLHYNLYFGVDVFGKWHSVFAIPGLALAIIIFNNAIAYLVYNKERILSYFLVYVQTIIALITFAAAIFVVLLNI